MDANGDDKFGFFRSFLRHRSFVADALERVVEALRRRARVHDLSKLMDDEFEGFSRINAAARVNKFGSPEYSEGMRRERGTIDLHFSRNSHHPERPRLIGEAAEAAKGLPDDYTHWKARDAAAMTWLDVIEMVCDWHGARAGYDDDRPWVTTAAIAMAKKGHLMTPEQRWLADQLVAFFDEVVG